MYAAAHSLDVLVVDDHQAFADAIALAIDAQADLHVMGSARTAQGALDALGGRCPDVILLDLGLPDRSGLELLPELNERCPVARVIVLTANTSTATVVAAANAGANGFLPKQQRFADVLEAIRSEDDLTLDSRTIARLVHAGAGDAESAMDRERPDVPALSSRESQVLFLLADGHSVKDVARQLSISVNTCRGYVSSLLAKFGAHSQLEMILKVARLGLLPNLRVDDG